MIIEEIKLIETKFGVLRNRGITESRGNLFSRESLLMWRGTNKELICVY